MINSAISDNFDIKLLIQKSHDKNLSSYFKRTMAFCERILSNVAKPTNKIMDIMQLNQEVESFFLFILRFPGSQAEETRFVPSPCTSIIESGSHQQRDQNC